MAERAALQACEFIAGLCWAEKVGNAARAAVGDKEAERRVLFAQTILDKMPRDVLAGLPSTDEEGER